jgi:protein-L-isoaspartate(D-aspartate) O-methyltransferase
MPPVSNHINNNNINNNNNWNRTSLSLSSSSLLLLPLLRSYTQYSIVRRLLSVVVVVVLLLLPNEVVVATTSSRTTTCPTTANRCGNHHHHHQRTRNLQPLTQSDNYSTAFIKTPNTFSSTSSTTAASTGSRSSNSKNNNIITMKAWTCHGRNQRDMVHQLQQAGIIRSPQVQQVMSLVDRKNYFPTSTTSSSSIPNSHYYYEDAPYPIGYGQTISAPHMHAYVLEEIITHLGPTAAPSPSSNIAPTQETSPLQFLDVGCGSGYITACLGRWLSPSPPTSRNNSKSRSILGVSGYVYGIDIVPELVTMSRTNIQKQDADLLLPPPPLVVETNGIDRTTTDDDASPLSPPPPQQPQPIVTIRLGNGYRGLPQYAPFDIIHVGAAAITFPYILCQQLKVGGLMIVPIHDDNNNNNNNLNTKSQTLYKIERLYDHHQDHPAGTKNTRRIDTTSTTHIPSTVIVSSAPDTNHDDDINDGNNESDDDASTSSFDINDYRITPLLGVRYVPLVHE